MGAKRFKIDSYVEAGGEDSVDEDLDEGDEYSDVGDRGADSKDSFSSLRLDNAMFARIFDCKEFCG